MTDRERHAAGVAERLARIPLSLLLRYATDQLEWPLDEDGGRDPVDPVEPGVPRTTE